MAPLDTEGPGVRRGRWPWEAVTPASVFQSFFLTLDTPSSPRPRP